MKKIAGTILLATMMIAASPAAQPVVTVYKTPTCGCCGKWVEHMRSNGFQVNVQEVNSTVETRRKYGVPDRLQSCHTALVNGYVIEGHVPAADVQRLLKSKPKAAGLAVPGMPMGSPGMEGPRSDAYSVLQFHQDGTLMVYKQYPAK